MHCRLKFNTSAVRDPSADRAEATSQHIEISVPIATTTIEHQLVFALTVVLS
jgi:hypothetical protein